ncbi:hypothetical protein A2707_02615 [Candidatus Saccharibacteria bacterium RIFCSPHIGHO2_01_FULL_45_15]|nr:MAG: hypothetical protein A2707_02615 [Candidatus Saccharibacteria bacterium RIFCSPHIGHO2_01_FULL_45_15]OGL27836.1 MAG: hypothetical protein A3C39_05030 [Candidatus Saccharibacteria bacterium RIFCSPHIGHO2_02_FULL_46_12]OGL31822.1 MAG: hypothetical protein A3E76_03210 [Candidatus Saccharibacteria bacterium RIFCSPHIGHO2_12_FULL_44_22]
MGIMKDIDFDELDKAVNSLMGGVSSIKPDQPDPKTLTIATTLKDNEAPEYKKLEQAAERIGNETLLVPVERTEILSLDDIDEPTDQPLDTDSTIEQQSSVPAQMPSDPPAEVPPMITKRPAGRFMDVMHPSSDMKTAATKSTALAPSVASSLAIASNTPTTSREGATIPSPAADETPADQIPVIETSTQSSIVSELDEYRGIETALEPFIETPVMSNSPIVDPTVIPVAAQNPSTFSPPNEQDPLVSPFLPDAKVEKRPLGGVAAADPTLEQTMLDEPVQVAEEKDAQRAVEINPELSEEYFSDLMAIESGANVAMEVAPQPESEQSAEIDQTPQPVQETVVDETALPEAAQEIEQTLNEVRQIQPTNIVEPVVQSDIIPSGPQSIAQQYSELPDSGDKESGSIYDVNDYHKPVAHPAKTSSGWLWVAIIVGIIAICGGGAAAFYFLTQNA